MVRGKRVLLEDNVEIGSNVTLSATEIHVGFGTRIEDNCRIALSGENSAFSVGDNCLIGHDSKIIVPMFTTGDYVTLHNHLFVNGIKPCTIGHNVWVGQNCILNARDTLTIGNGVGIGTYSCVWTHGGHGELLEGCRILKIAPVVIEDDAWIVGSFNVISPGVRVGEKAVILTGSVVTKNVAPRSCVAGNPARDITDKVQPYEAVTLERKYEMMKTFIKEHVDTFDRRNVDQLENGWRITDGNDKYEIIFLEKAQDNALDDKVIRVVFTKENATVRRYNNVSIFDLSNKIYTKKRTRPEIAVIRSLLYSKARFVPS